MAQIERIRISEFVLTEPYVYPYAEGEYVKYDDHERIVKALEKEIEALKEELELAI